MDTSALIAFLDRSDSFHTQYRRLFADPPPLATSALVIAEGHGWFLRRYDAARAIQFLSFVSALEDLTILPFDSDALYQASRTIRKFADQKLTLADAHGLAIMTARRTRVCWSTDRHMGLTGVALAV